MSPEQPSTTPFGTSAAQFTATRWDLVVAAGAGESSVADAALEALCQAYWPPIYAHIRRSGHTPEDARDLTQDFFMKVLDRRSFAAADPARGRFRSYLLGALKHFLSDARDYARAQKRGGGRELLPLDAQGGEESYAWEPVDELTPDKLFERRWALTLITKALQRLQEECELAGKAALFMVLKGFLSDGAATRTYPEAAAELGMTEAAVRMTVTRLRRRYGELVQAEVADTVESPQEAETELRYLLALLREH